MDGFVIQDYVYRAKNVDTGDFIQFNEEKCDGCGMCNSVCMANLWAVPKNNKTRLSPKYRELCLECAACYAVCNQDAIDFSYPKGGSGIIIKYG